MLLMVLAEGCVCGGVARSLGCLLPCKHVADVFAFCSGSVAGSTFGGCGVGEVIRVYVAALFAAGLAVGDCGVWCAAGVAVSSIAPILRGASVC